MTNKGTLLLLHGLTGTGEMFQQIGEYICPSDWKLITPDAPFKHPKSGFTWWEDFETPESELDFERLYNQTIVTFEKIKASLPDTGSLIIGGFSQGGVMAQLILVSELANRIKGLLLIGTCLPRNSVGLELLSTKISKLSPIPVLWIHGETDHLISLQEAECIVEFFERHGWQVTKIIHHKGHAIPLEFNDNIRQWATEISNFH